MVPIKVNNVLNFKKKSETLEHFFFLINSLANFHLPVLVQTLLQLLSMYLPFALKLLSAVFCPLSLTSIRRMISVVLRHDTKAAKFSPIPGQQK